MSIHNKIIRDLEQVMDQVSEGQSDAAIVALWRLRSAVRKDMIEGQLDTAVAAAVQKYELPPMKKINVSPGRAGTSITVSCPTCKAKAGDYCFRMNRRGFGAVPINERNPAHYHPARTAKAKGGE